MEKKTIRISRKELETFGSMSLTGKLFKENKHWPVCELTIEFEREEYKPQNITIPDSVPMCLCDNIVHLVEQGFKIKISSYN